jgi:hypothetical protein
LKRGECEGIETEKCHSVVLCCVVLCSIEEFEKDENWFMDKKAQHVWFPPHHCLFGNYTVIFVFPSWLDIRDWIRTLLRLITDSKKKKSSLENIICNFF